MNVSYNYCFISINYNSVFLNQTYTKLYTAGYCPWPRGWELTFKHKIINFSFVSFTPSLSLFSVPEKSGVWSRSFLSLCSQQSRRRMSARPCLSCWRPTSIHHRQATRFLQIAFWHQLKILKLALSLFIRRWQTLLSISSLRGHNSQHTDSSGLNTLMHFVVMSVR